MTGRMEGEAQYEASCLQFLCKKYDEKLEEILRQEDVKGNYPIVIDYVKLYDQVPEVADRLLRQPDVILEVFDNAAKRGLFEKLEALNQKVADDMPIYTLKLNVHVRIGNLPSTPQLYKTLFPASTEAGKFVTVVGTVVRTTTAKVLEYSKTYVCSKCNGTEVVKAVPSRFHAYPKSIVCPNQECRGQKKTGNKLTAQTEHEFSNFRDYQEIKFQEQSNHMIFGSMSKAMNVVLEDDLVNSCNPGDDVGVTGTLYLRWKTFKKEQAVNAELVLRANHIENKNDVRISFIPDSELKSFIDIFWKEYKDNPYEGRNQILSSICPNILGMYLVKLAVAMVLAGGVSKTVSGMDIRGDCNMLMIGDPGTAKSQFLRFVSQLGRRSVFTTGIGSSSAGLTVSAVKEEGEWQLQAGALVLADGGICCIDEISYMNKNESASIHEAMEQQSISIAKAGMVVRIPTRVTVIAATNPKGNAYDLNKSLTSNTNISSPLMSRFDVVFILLDVQDDGWDEAMSNFLFKNKSITMSDENPWTFDRLRSYLLHIKELKPQVTAEAGQLIMSYYQHKRLLKGVTGDGDDGRTTVRLLESIRRLSEGHARLMYRNEVIVYDVITAIYIMEASTSISRPSDFVDPVNAVHSMFPASAIMEYRQQAERVLKTLQLDTYWEQEEQRLKALQQAEDAEDNKKRKSSN